MRALLDGRCASPRGPAAAACALPTCTANMCTAGAGAFEHGPTIASRLLVLLSDAAGAPCGWGRVGGDGGGEEVAPHASGPALRPRGPVAQWQAPQVGVSEVSSTRFFLSSFKKRACRSRGKVPLGQSGYAGFISDVNSPRFGHFRVLGARNGALAREIERSE